MARRRRVNDGLPKYVRRRSYGVIYTPYLGKGRHGKDINLGPSDLTVPGVWEAYHRETKQDTDTLRWMLTEFHQSKKFKALRPKTQKAYDGYRMILLSYPMASGKVFGGARLVRIRRTAIQGLVDKYHAPIAINRMIQYLKSAWNWAANRHDDVPENPCIGVELNKQTARTRYVTQTEFQAFKATTTGYIPAFMELAYLCRARWSEVAALKVSDILTEGLCLVRGKGSEGEITAWTPRLREAVDAARAFNSGAPSPLSGAYLVHGSRGQAISQNAFQSAWGRAMRKYAKTDDMRFTYHDLKAAGYSDQKKQDAGHKSDKMHSTYNRKLRVVQPAE